MNYEIRDKRSGFLWITNKIFDGFAAQLHPTTFMVYVALCRLANNETQCCYPSQTKLGKMIGVTPRTVRDSVAVLVKRGLICVVASSGQLNSYSLVDTPEIISAVGPVDPGSPLPQYPGSPLPQYPGSPLPQYPGSPLPPNKTYMNKTQLNKTHISQLNASAEKIYHAYPRKVAKPKALEKIKKALTEHSEEYLLARTQRFASSPAGQRGIYVPHPATWFHQARYNDAEAEWFRRDPKTAITYEEFEAQRKSRKANP